MNPVKIIDNFLNSITMYKLVLYGLLVVASLSLVLSFLQILTFKPHELVFSLLLITGVCYLTNFVASKILKAPTNSESWFITAVILFFLMEPSISIPGSLWLVAASIIAMLSKYVFALDKKHVFNPAAISVFILGVIGSPAVFWWVGSRELIPFTLILGLLIVRKIRRFQLFGSFLLVSLFMITISAIIKGYDPVITFVESFVSWPLIFFGTVMLTEPLTTPPTKKKQLMYGSLVGFLFGSQFSFGPVYSSPELALLVGNIFSYIVSPKKKLFLTLLEKNEIAKDIYEFKFVPDKKFEFKPGQYLEWTLPHAKADTRGNRRYFTIASSPKEKTINLGVKIVPDQSSSFKKALLAMEKGGQMVASQLTGDFVLPKEIDKKYVFIAGGIGVTPFRSILQHLVDTGRPENIVLFYSASTADSFAYTDVIENAAHKISLKYIPVLGDEKNVPDDWSGKVGRITPEIITSEVPDFNERMFYLSGPNAMVEAYEGLLKGLGVKGEKIVKDYFPGY